MGCCSIKFWSVLFLNYAGCCLVVKSYELAKIYWKLRYVTVHLRCFRWNDCWFFIGLAYDHMENFIISRPSKGFRHVNKTLSGLSLWSVLLFWKCNSVSRHHAYRDEWTSLFWWFIFCFVLCIFALGTTGGRNGNWMNNVKSLQLQCITMNHLKFLYSFNYFSRVGADQTYEEERYMLLPDFTLLDIRTTSY